MKIILLFFIFFVLFLFPNCEEKKICPQGSVKVNNHCEFANSFDIILKEIKQDIKE